MSAILDGYEALGTKFWVEIYDEVITFSLSVLGENVIGILKDFEKKYSRFDTNSLLNKYNRGEVKYADLDEEFVDILAKSHHFMEISDNIFDIYIQDKLVEKGYGPFNTTPSASGTSPRGGLNTSEAEAPLGELPVGLRGLNFIDLGGIGKGYVIDKISRLLKEKNGIKYFLINGGGDMYMTSDNEKPIEMYMQHPINRDEYIDTLHLKDKAFCASSSFVRILPPPPTPPSRGGGQAHLRNHFITPDGSEVWAASYIVGDDAATADVAATIACILSNQKEKLEQVMNRLSVQYYVINERGERLGNMI